MPEVLYRQKDGQGRRSIVLDRFRGVDLTSGPMNVDASRSPDALNMMPNDDGFPVKRKGYNTIEQYDGAVYGAYSLVDGEKVVHLVHAGSKLYCGGVAIATEMALAPSMAVQMAYKAYNDTDEEMPKPMLWIVDGKTYRCFDGETVRTVSEIATVPLVTIAKPPNGMGGTSYLPINMLSARRTDSFQGTEEDTVYYLTSLGLSSSEVKVETLSADGIFVEQKSGYTVNPMLGRVTFTIAPGPSPVKGADNVRITYQRASKADTIGRCNIIVSYGLNGAKDRVFLSGRPDAQNVDHWSDYRDPTYIGDTFYACVGQAGNPIVGYSQVGNKMVIHKRGEENGCNAVVRTGEFGESDMFVEYTSFPVENVLQGEGAISHRTIGHVPNEPLFLTRQGVFALTSNDVTGERYMQCRSYYLNGALLRERELNNACATVFGRFYVLAVGGKMYLLDTGQKQYDGASPHSAFQYEGYVWTDLPATIVFVRADPASGEETLCFGTAGGRVCAFGTGAKAADYADDGRVIECYWTTPLLSLGTFARRKTVSGVWVVSQPYTRSGGEILYMSDRETARAAYGYELDILDFGDIDFARFCFNALDRPAIVPGGKKAKKVKLFSVRVANSKLNEAFGLEAIQIEFRAGGKVRR